MQCSCVYVGDGGDHAEFSTVKIQTARKTHICSDCGEAIIPSENYEYVSGLWNGDFQVYKTCGICLELRRVFFCEGWICGEIRQFLWDHVCEMRGQISEDCILELSQDARDVVFKMIEDIWGD